MFRGSLVVGLAALAALGVLGGSACDTSDPDLGVAQDETAPREDDSPARLHARPRSSRPVPRELASAGAADVCHAYCDAFLRRCDGTLASADPPTCMAACRGWPAGAAGEAGDTVACRLEWLDAFDGAGSCIAAAVDSPTCRDA